MFSVPTASSHAVNQATFWRSQVGYTLCTMICIISAQIIYLAFLISSQYLIICDLHSGCSFLIVWTCETIKPRHMISRQDASHSAALFDDHKWPSFNSPRHFSPLECLIQHEIAPPRLEGLLPTALLRRIMTESLPIPKVLRNEQNIQLR